MYKLQKLSAGIQNNRMYLIFLYIRFRVNPEMSLTHFVSNIVYI